MDTPSAPPLKTAAVRVVVRPHRPVETGRCVDMILAGRQSRETGRLGAGNGVVRFKTNFVAPAPGLTYFFAP